MVAFEWKQFQCLLKNLMDELDIIGVQQ